MLHFIILLAVRRLSMRRALDIVLCIHINIRRTLDALLSTSSAVDRVVRCLWKLSPRYHSVATYGRTWACRFVRSTIMPPKSSWLRDEYHDYDITDKFSSAVYFITVRLLSYTLIGWIIRGIRSTCDVLRESLRRDGRSLRSEHLARFICTDWMIGTLDSRFVAIYLSDDYLSKNIWSQTSYYLLIWK